MVACLACSSSPSDTPPPTIPAAQAAVSPAVTGKPDGIVLPLAGAGEAAVFEPATSSLTVLERAPASGSQLIVYPTSGPVRTIPLPAPATAIVADGGGTVFAAAKGGYFSVDVRAGTVPARTSTEK
jgi:hypothetical protein